MAYAVERVLTAGRVSCRALARSLERSASTLRAWWECGRDLVAGKARRDPGRPRKTADRLTRRDIITAIHASRGKITIAGLRAAYPEVGRSELSKIRTHYRRIMRKRRRRGLSTLQWEVPGAVWAMDHTVFPGGVEGCSRDVLVVRELATGETLYADVCRQDAASVCAVLERLFAEHGAPVAMKSDNGSCFISEPTRLLLAAHGVLVAYSPPGTPSYNGSCEAGVASIKHRALDFAAGRRGRGAVTRDDLALAREQANSEVTVVATCPEVLAQLRAAAWTRYRVWERRLREEQGIAPEAPLRHAEQASLDRFAIRRALTETHILTIRRRD